MAQRSVAWSFVLAIQAISAFTLGCSVGEDEVLAGDGGTSPSEVGTEASADTGSADSGAAPIDATADSSPEASVDAAEAAVEAGSGTRPACSSCDKSSDCQAGLVCLDLGFGAPGRWCAHRQADVAGGDCKNVRPFRKAESLPIVGGETVTVCMPAFAMCSSLARFKQKCGSGSSCGPGGDCWARSGASFLCTLKCADDYDCPVGSSCTELAPSTKRCTW